MSKNLGHSNFLQQILQNFPPNDLLKAFFTTSANPIHLGAFLFPLLQAMRSSSHKSRIQSMEYSVQGGVQLVSHVNNDCHHNTKSISMIVNTTSTKSTSKNKSTGTLLSNGFHRFLIHGIPTIIFLSPKRLAVSKFQIIS